MSALDVATRLISSGDELLVPHFERCLHQISVEADCEACLQICPTDAITKDGSLVFEKAGCTGCLACVPACPTGVFTAKSQLAGLLRCAAHSPTAEVELLCEFHPARSAGQGGNPAVRVRGCLAGLGAGSLLCVLETGVRKVTLRCDECSTCAQCELQNVINRTVSDTHSLLKWADDAPIAIQRQPSDTVEGEGNVLWNADNPPMSRRELFQFTTHKGSLLAIEVLGDQVEASGKTVGEERLRLNAGLKRLGAAQRIKPEATLEPFDYATVVLSDDCTACAACARVCPTGALAFKDMDDKFTLIFKPELCIACGLCSKVCILNAIELETNLTAGQLAESSTAITLLEGERSKCYRCGGWFFTRGNTNLCPVCSFRSQNPFSSKLPPGIDLQPPAGEVQS